MGICLCWWQNPQIVTACDQPQRSKQNIIYTALDILKFIFEIKILSFISKDMVHTSYNSHSGLSRTESAVTSKAANHKQSK